MAITFDSLKLEGPVFEAALNQVCFFFQLDALYDDQVHAIRSFLKGNNVFFCAATGYGKSIIFQCMPLLVDILSDQVVGTSTMIVVSPLVSLMLDQVSKMRQYGINAVAIFQDQDEDVLNDILDGVYSLVYTSPESMLGTKKWEKLWKCQTFMDSCVGIAIDEAHCISQWLVLCFLPATFTFAFMVYCF